jgi:uncharacterized membrane protein YeaQ/YmgE (transglycosylase-associated protein family)
MGLILTLILGGLAGLLASKIMNRDADQGLILNIIVGIVGSVLANFLITPLIGGEARLDVISVQGFVLSLLGAVVLLAIINLITRGKAR